MNFIQRIFFKAKTSETESLMKNTRKVKSMTTPNTFYEIDMEKNSCSCPSYQFSSLVDKDFQCKHLLGTKNTRKVKSMTTPNTFYEIDMEKNSCSCPSYQFSSLVDKDFQCKHLLSIPCH